MNESKFSLPRLNIPSPYAQTLVDALTPFVTFKRYPKGVRLQLKEGDTKVCFLFSAGSFEVHRTLDDLIIGRAEGTAIPGLGISDAYLLTTTPCLAAKMPLSEIHHHITELGLGEVLLKHMMVLTSKLYTYSRQLSAPTVYEVICNQLVELLNEPESFRREMTAERYIRSRTHISRSSVMKMLAELKKGGYIVIEEGRLIEICHLPSKY